MNGTFAVKVENLTRTFQEVEVIKNCNLNVKKGTVYGLLGQNGAGKTTIFKMLSGLLVPTMGEIRVLGMDIVSERNEILRNIGTLIDMPIFYEHLSATENLKIHLSYMDNDTLNITDILSKVGLNSTGPQPVSKFSLGMRQRLAIARAIVHKPKLLILDEPVNGLDPIGIRQMRELFLELVHNQGMTLLISSHILTEIEHIADTIGIIVNGTVVREASLSEIKINCTDGLESYFMDAIIGEEEDVKIN